MIVTPARIVEMMGGAPFAVVVEFPIGSPVFLIVEPHENEAEARAAAQAKFRDATQVMVVEVLDGELSFVEMVRDVSKRPAGN